MRSGTISINGKRHVLCFSVRVVRNCAERYGELNGLYAALSSENHVQALDESLWILAEMMKAGAKYAAEHGLENAEPMSVDDLYDSCGFDDLAGIRSSIMLTINNGKRTNVEAEASPNAEATRES